MDPRLRTSLVCLAAACAAVYLGWQVAEGAYALPALTAVVILGSVLVRFTGIPADTIFLGFLLIGYIVGNRGFAQLMPAPELPLLPAEAGLLVAVGWRIIVCAFERQLPFQRDALNWVVLAWLLVGTGRVVFDVPRHGILALRDYAMIYYAVFFYLAQHMAREALARRYLTYCLLVAVLLLPPMFLLFYLFPSFFLDLLTIRGVPLIYYKGDLAATFMAVGSLVVFHAAKEGHRYWAWPASAGLFLFILSYDSRASLLGLVVASLFLLLTRRWRFPSLQGGIAVVALLAVVALAALFDNSWANRKLHGFSERLRSIADITGRGQYESQESYFKGDNNRFRLVWWKNVVVETWTTNPALGQGFGADLAHGFLQEYYPDATEEFSARSPHNIFLTSFGRMGLAGLALWLAFTLTLLLKTWAVLRRSPEPLVWGLWCAAWVIMCSATFGVVLEGPMGAVVFWTLLGLANAYPSGIATPAGESLAVAPPARDPQPAAA